MSYSITELETVSVRRLLWRYALPAIIAMTASSLYNLVDSIFIGRCVGPLALSALAIAKPLMDICAAFGAMIGVGGGAFLSIKLGEKDYHTANKILGNVIVFNILLGMVVMIAGLLFLDELLLLCGASNDTLFYAHSYMEVILYGNIFTHIYFGLNNLLRSMGKPKIAMYATIVAVITNIFLDYLFVYVMGMGTRGAAWGTVIAQTVAICLQIFIYCNRRQLLHFQRNIWKPTVYMAKNILTIGIAPFLMNLAICFVVIILNNQLKTYGGDLSIASFGIINRVTFIFMMIVMGLNQGMQPIVGYNFGAKRFDRMWQAFKLTSIFATIIMGVVFLLGECIPRPLIMMFTEDQTLIEQTIKPMRIITSTGLVIGFQMVTVNFFTSIGQVKKSIFLSLTRQVIYFIPFCLILPKFVTPNINGVWFSLPISDVLAAITTTIILLREIKRIKNGTDISY